MFSTLQLLYFQLKGVSNFCWVCVQSHLLQNCCMWESVKCKSWYHVMKAATDTLKRRFRKTNLRAFASSVNPDMSSMSAIQSNNVSKKVYRCTDRSLFTLLIIIFINTSDNYTPFEEEGVYRSHCVGLSVYRSEAIFCPAYFLQTTGWNSIKFYMKLLLYYRVMALLLIKLWCRSRCCLRGIYQLQ